MYLLTIILFTLSVCFSVGIFVLILLICENAFYKTYRCFILCVQVFFPSYFDLLILWYLAINGYILLVHLFLCFEGT